MQPRASSQSPPRSRENRIFTRILPRASSQSPPRRRENRIFTRILPRASSQSPTARIWDPAQATCIASGVADPRIAAAPPRTMPTARVLHAFCTRLTRVLHAFCTRFARILHALYTHFTCSLRAACTMPWRARCAAHDARRCVVLCMIMLRDALDACYTRPPSASHGRGLQ